MLSLLAVLVVISSSDFDCISSQVSNATEALVLKTVVPGNSVSKMREVIPPAWFKNGVITSESGTTGYMSNKDEIIFVTHRLVGNRFDLESAFRACLGEQQAKSKWLPTAERPFTVKFMIGNQVTGITLSAPD